MGGATTDMAACPHPPSAVPQTLGSAATATPRLGGALEINNMPRVGPLILQATPVPSPAMRWLRPPRRTTVPKLSGKAT